VLLGACLIVLNQLQQMKLWNKDDQLTMVWINTAASVRESPCFRWLTVYMRNTSALIYWKYLKRCNLATSNEAITCD